jgi:hypothetical protein
LVEFEGFDLAELVCGIVEGKGFVLVLEREIVVDQLAVQFHFSLIFPCEKVTEFGGC